MDWDNLRFFLAVTRKNSIRGASSTLGVNASTVSRRIDAFEKKIGVRLFERLPSGYVLTPAGEEMVGAAERMENEILTLERRVIGRDTQLDGTLRVTLPVALATHLLMPDFATFGSKYPGIKLEVVVSSELFNLSKREADVAIRITDNPPDYLVGRNVAKTFKAVYVSEDYLRHHDIEKHPELMRWVGWENISPETQCIKEYGPANIPIHHQSNDLLVQLEACRNGMGLVSLPCFIADPIPNLRRLSPLISEKCGDIWILTHKDLRSTVRVNTFTKFMSNAFVRHRDLLIGNRESKDYDLLNVAEMDELQRFQQKEHA